MNAIEKTVITLIDQQAIALISSVDAQGYPSTKAMLAPRKREGLVHFYFTTNTSSMHVAHYKKNPKACLYFCDSLLFKGVTLKGQMTVLEDAASKTMVWHQGDELYYSLGVTDPDYCMLKFTAATGRYYFNFNSQDFLIASDTETIPVAK